MNQSGPSKHHKTLKRKLVHDRGQTEPSSVIWPSNGLGLFFQHHSLHGTLGIKGRSSRSQGYLVWKNMSNGSNSSNSSIYVRKIDWMRRVITVAVAVLTRADGLDVVSRSVRKMTVQFVCATSRSHGRRRRDDRSADTDRRRRHVTVVVTASRCCSRLATVVRRFVWFQRTTEQTFDERHERAAKHCRRRTTAKRTALWHRLSVQLPIHRQQTGCVAYEDDITVPVMRMLAASATISQSVSQWQSKYNT